MIAESRTSFVNQLIGDRPVPRLVWQVLFAVVGTAILAISAKTKVMLGPVDLSLQTLAVFLIGAAFGARLAAATVVLYLVEGMLGLPVFQGTPEKGIGLAYMMGPTAGYLAGFLVAAVVVGWAADRGLDRRIPTFAAAVLLAEVAILGLGFAWLSTLIGMEKAWQFGVAPFIVADLIKVALAALLAPACWVVFSLIRR